MESRHHLGTEVHKRGYRSDKSDNSNCLSHVSGMNTSLDATSKLEHKVYACTRPDQGTIQYNGEHRMRLLLLTELFELFELCLRQTVCRKAELCSHTGAVTALSRVAEPPAARCKSEPGQVFKDQLEFVCASR